MITIDSPITSDLKYGVDPWAIKLVSYKELRVYQNAMDSAMDIFERTRSFPPEEKYSMVDQMRRSSRSVCANIAEGAWQEPKTLLKAAFIAKLSDAGSEACETQVWIDVGLRNVDIWISATAEDLTNTYELILGQIVKDDSRNSD